MYVIRTVADAGQGCESTQVLVSRQAFQSKLHLARMSESDLFRQRDKGTIVLARDGREEVSPGRGVQCHWGIWMGVVMVRTVLGMK